MMETLEMETGTGLSYASERLVLLERDGEGRRTGDLDSAELAGWAGSVLAKRRPGLAYAKGGASTIGAVIELRLLGSRGRCRGGRPERMSSCKPQVGTVLSCP